MERFNIVVLEKILLEQVTSIIFFFWKSDAVYGDMR